MKRSSSGMLLPELSIRRRTKFSLNDSHCCWTTRTNGASWGDGDRRTCSLNIPFVLSWPSVGNGEEYISKNAVPSSLVSMEIDVFEIIISANGRSCRSRVKNSIAIDCVGDEEEEYLNI